MIDGTVDDKPHTFGPVEPEEFMFALASADATASPPTCLQSKRSALRLGGEIGFNLIAVQYSDRKEDADSLIILSA
jgi:hypothetical protein